MADIKSLVDSGMAFPVAFKAVVAESGGVRGFAMKYNLPDTAVSAVINGSTPYRYENVRHAIASHFGVERAWVDEQIDAMREHSLTETE